MALTSKGKALLPMPRAQPPISVTASSEPLGTQLDFASFGSIQVTISHFPVMGKVCCEYQSQTVVLTSLTQASLPLTQPKSPDQPVSEEEFWVKATHFTQLTSDYTASRLLGSDQKCVVSSFVSMISESKHDDTSLITGQSTVAQHMNVHFLSH